MSKNSIGDIRIFVEVARKGGFRAAAEHLQQAPASISQAIRRFEDRLGVKLFERSTRNVALTPIGEQFYQRSLPAVVDLEVAINDLDDQKDELAGDLCITAPYSAGPFFLDDLVARFAAKYESINLEVIYDDNKVNLVTERVDVAIRSNTMLEQDTYAFSVGPELNMSIVASSEYLAKRGIPQNPKDILDHDAICYKFGHGGNLAPWTFNGTDGEFTIQPNYKMVANDMRSLLFYAQKHLGLAYVYSEIAAPFLARNDVTEVLQEHLKPLPRYSLNYRSKRHMSKRLRAFIDMAKDAD